MLTIDATLEDGVSAALQQLAERAEDMSPVMLEIAGYLREQIEVRFATQTDPEGAPWKKSRRAEKVGGQTLTDRADLRRSMRTDHGRDFAAAGPEASGGAARYAEVHQTGFAGPVVVPFHKRTITQIFGERLAEPRETFVSTHFRRMKLPARRYLGFTAADGEEVLQILLPWLGQPVAGVVQ